MSSRKTRQALRAAEREFSKRAYEASRERVSKYKLTVLILGPSPRFKTPASRKRNELQEALSEEGHLAMLGEDVDPPRWQTKSERGTHSLRTIAYDQAVLADVVFNILDGSAGAQCEAHDMFCTVAMLKKLYMFIPKSQKAGYSGKGIFKEFVANRGEVMWYGSDDLRDCNLVKKALADVRAIQELKANGLIK